MLILIQKEMERIARQLPLSQVKRPQWDINTLLDIGFIRYSVDIRIGDHVWDEEEKLITAQPYVYDPCSEKIIDENDKRKIM